ncbi:MAG: tRNA pseudouridine(38-40) synthase TruA, partial [Lentisphaeria bacterium]|nr:tRNA pseudouridine(38-40) synthase TruA [Lentisphaeria bacterium]
MSVYRMRIAFNGSRYAGWQRQTGLTTVQQSVEEVLHSVFHDDALTVTACGRTDAGVHALDMTLSFRTEAESPGLQSLLKQRLPHDIRLLEIAPAPEDFNAHKSALGKAYVYAVSPGEPN